MDLEKIKNIVNSKITDELKCHLIVDCLAKDEQVIPLMLQILQVERIRKEKISMEMNQLLSKADVGLDDVKFNEGGFMQKEIYEFYKKHKDVPGVGHCFKQLKF